jgi:hypothetical protein
MAPLLTASPVPLSQDAFAAVVQKGGRTDKGMPSFSQFSDEDLLAIRHYIRKSANKSASKGVLAGR